MKRSRAAIGAAIAVMFVSCSYACSPDFDSAYLVRASKDEFLAVPEGDFLFELSRVSGKKVSFDKTVPVDLAKGKDSTARADDKDLENALAGMKISKTEKQKVLASYAGIRAQIVDYLKTNTVEYPSIWYGGRFRSLIDAPKLALDLKFAPSIPEEFVLYTRGAVSYHNKDFEAAIGKWKELLALPKDKRRFKSTWASFMIGKAYLSMLKQKNSLAYFELTRKLASEGFSDSLGLARESYGWQALAEYELKDYVSSLNNYLEALDVNSLNRVCNKIYELDDTVLEKVVKDDTARQIIIGWVVSRPTKYSSSYWFFDDENKPEKDIYAWLLKAIEKTRPKGAVASADRIAWVYYTKGDIDNAKKWLALSKKGSALSGYIGVKIMLRDGKVDEAIDSLRKLIPLFEKSPEKGVFFENDVVRGLNTDIGVLELSRKDYIMAFNVLLKGKYWEDVAYVAEKVLTSSELENYLKQHAKDKEMSNPREMYDGYYMEMQYFFERNPDPQWQKEWELALKKDTLYQALKYLLARRFAREENWSKSVEYMPDNLEILREESTPGEDGVLNWEQKTENAKLREICKTFIGFLYKARDLKEPGRDRAQSYYEAGRILRKYGMELMGTELDPDGFVVRGGFMYYDSLESRMSIVPPELKKEYIQWREERLKELDAKRKEIEKNRDFFTASVDEEKRVLKSLPDPLKRYHYRYKAADLMWKCAELLPDNDELKAKALCLGGTYLKDRDKEAADKFYKALVRTCGETKLGKEADKKRWFPKVREIN